MVRVFLSLSVYGSGLSLGFFFITISGLKLEIVMHMTSYLFGPFTNVLIMFKCHGVTSQSVDFSKLVNRFFVSFIFQTKEAY